MLHNVNRSGADQKGGPKPSILGSRRPGLGPVCDQNQACAVRFAIKKGVPDDPDPMGRGQVWDPVLNTFHKRRGRFIDVFTSEGVKKRVKNHRFRGPGDQFGTPFLTPFGRIRASTEIFRYGSLVFCIRSVLGPVREGSKTIDFGVPGVPKSMIFGTSGIAIHGF